MMTDTTKKRRTPRPVLLNKAEALAYAADNLEKMADDMNMAKMILDMFKGRDIKLEGEALEIHQMMKAEMPAPDIQMAALKDAAQAIRDLSMEERLVEARVKAGSVA